MHSLEGWSTKWQVLLECNAHQPGISATRTKCPRYGRCSLANCAWCLYLTTTTLAAVLSNSAKNQKTSAECTLVLCNSTEKKQFDSVSNSIQFFASPMHTSTKHNSQPNPAVIYFPATFTRWRLHYSRYLNRLPAGHFQQHQPQNLMGSSNKSTS